MDRSETIKSHLAEFNPDALLADGFDEALLGTMENSAGNCVAVYDADRCVTVLAKDMSHEEASEYFEFNVRGSHVGENGPVFIDTHQE